MKFVPNKSDCYTRMSCTDSIADLQYEFHESTDDPKFLRTSAIIRFVRFRGKLVKIFFVFIKASNNSAIQLNTINNNNALKYFDLLIFVRFTRARARNWFYVLFLLLLYRLSNIYIYISIVYVFCKKKYSRCRDFHGNRTN